LICSKLRSLIEEAVKKNLADGLLLSGGLDTSVIATIASRFTQLKAFTVGFKRSQAPDIKYATMIAKRLGIKHFVHVFDEEELYVAVPEVVRIMRSFDPVGTRSSISIYIVLSDAKREGLEEVMTGDGGDECFVGYDHLLNLEGEELEFELNDLLGVNEFASNRLGKALGITIKQPFLDPEVKAFARSLATEYKIRSHRGEKWGKWIVRKAFEDVLPKEIAWRRSALIETGSGTISLTDFFDKKISDEEFTEKKNRFLQQDKVTIRSKEHLYYYEAYRSVIGVPHPTEPIGKTCPECNSNMAENARFCRTCGAPATKNFQESL